eukprot:TRINITY_DN61_c1_g1_i1.p1 TRINITY_DN61_c1_g1~~TRINITY_DN61_c1_g1_i1.p1  ORF type:complete len:203 (+),score=27.15 TRINITY_DN61_c1_g1_i1:65-673(+)
MFARTPELDVEILHWLPVKEWAPVRCSKKACATVESAGRVLVSEMERKIKQGGGILDEAERSEAERKLVEAYREQESRVCQDAGLLKKRDLVKARNMEAHGLVVQAGSIILGKPTTFVTAQRYLFMFDLPNLLFLEGNVLRKLSRSSITPHVSHPVPHDGSKALIVLFDWVANVCACKEAVAKLTCGVDIDFLKLLRNRFNC